MIFFIFIVWNNIENASIAIVELKRKIVCSAIEFKKEQKKDIVVAAGKGHLCYADLKTI